MNIHKRPFIAFTLLISALIFTSPSVYAVKKLKTYGLPSPPVYKKKDAAYLYLATSSPACADNYNKVVIDGAFYISFSYSWWKIYWCDRLLDNNGDRLEGSSSGRRTTVDIDLRMAGPKSFSPGTYKFKLQSESSSRLDSSKAMTRIIKFKQTFAPGEFWLLFTQFKPDGKFGYVLMKLGKCGSLKRFEAPPESDKQDHNRYRILSGITRNIKTYLCGVNGTR